MVRVSLHHPLPQQNGNQITITLIEKGLKLYF